VAVGSGVSGAGRPRKAVLGRLGWESCPGTKATVWAGEAESCPRWVGLGKVSWDESRPTQGWAGKDVLGMKALGWVGLAKARGHFLANGPHSGSHADPLLTPLSGYGINSHSGSHR
jgi:hypothetical protein